MLLEEAMKDTPIHNLRLLPYLSDVPQKEVDVYCDVCQAIFAVPLGQQPDVCPEEDPPDDAAHATDAQS